MATETMLTTGEICGRLSICRMTLRRWTALGLFPAPHRLGPRVLRWPSSEVEAFIARGGVHVGNGVVPTEGGWIASDHEIDAADLAAIDESE